MDLRRRLSGIPIKIGENKTENRDNCIKYAKLKEEFDRKCIVLSPGANEKSSEKHLKAEQELVDSLARGDFKNDGSKDKATESFSGIKYTILKEEFDNECTEMCPNADEKSSKNNLKEEQKTVNSLEKEDFKNDGSKKYDILNVVHKSKCTEVNFDSYEESSDKDLKRKVDSQAKTDCKNDGSKKYAILKEELNSKFIKVNSDSNGKGSNKDLKAKADSQANAVFRKDGFKKYAILKEELNSKCIEVNSDSYEKKSEKDLKVKQEAVDSLVEGDFKNNRSKDKARTKYKVLKEEFDGKSIELSREADKKISEKHVKVRQEVIDYQNDGSKTKSTVTIIDTKIKDSGFKRMKEKEAFKKKTAKIETIKNIVSRKFTVKNPEPSYQSIKTEDEASELYRYLLFVFLIILYLFWVYKTCL